MHDTWILVANGARAHVVATDVPRNMQHDDALVEIACFEHPESRAKMAELTADGYGRHAQNGGHGVESSDFIEQSDVRENEKHAFARELLAAVQQASDDQLFKRLVLVMPAAFYGYFKTLLPKRLQEQVFLHINKDYSALAKHELRLQLVPHLSLTE